MTANSYIHRLLDDRIEELLGAHPALLVTGPRATGKTTTAARHCKTILRMDSPAQASVAEADPDALLHGLDEPILIDEWQLQPQMVGAVKRAVDASPRPGRFILTGSAAHQRSMTLWPGTGRLLHVAMWPMSARELRRDAEDVTGLLAALCSGAFDIDEWHSDFGGLRHLLDITLRSGFPQPAVRLGEEQRVAWLTSYLDQVITHDLDTSRRDPGRLSRYLEALALHTSTVTGDVALQRAAGIDRRTAIAYEKLLVDTGILVQLPAWWSNRLKRLVQRPKRLLCDAALAAAAARLSRDGLMRDGTMLGRVIETYAVMQLKASVDAELAQARMFHLRTEQGRHEVDIVVELADRRVVAFEVKVGVAPTAQDARHLIWLREQLGESFVGAVVLHAGHRAFSLHERIWAVPIARL